MCSSGKHYPLEFRRFRKREESAEGAPSPPFKNHTDLFKELVDWVVEREIPGDFAFDGYFSSAESLNPIQGHKRGYVGDLKSNRKVRFKGGEMKAAEWAAGGRPRGAPTGRHRRSQTVVFHPDRASSPGRSSRSPGDSVGSQERQEAGQVPGDQPGVLGDPSYLERLSQTLDGHGDLSSGRQATSGYGGLVSYAPPRARPGTCIW